MKLLMSLFLLVTASAFAQSNDRSLTSSFQVVSNEPSQEYIFGRVEIQQQRFAFVIDSSTSFQHFQAQVVASISKTINELDESQSFTIVYLTDRNRYFNDGVVVKATRENKDNAIRFLNNVPRENIYEPLTEAIQKLAQQNGELDRIFFFGDGDVTPRGPGGTNVSRRSPEFKELIQVLEQYPVAITARSGFGDERGIRDRKMLRPLEEMILETYEILKVITDMNGGTLISEGLEYQ